MAGADFAVSMVLRAVNQMSPIIQQTTRQLKKLQTQIDQLNATSNKGTWFDRAITNVDKFQGKLKTAQDAMDKLVKSGEKDLLTGGIMALPLVGAIKSAANVQRTQTSLQLAGLTQSQVNTLTTQAQQNMRKTMFGTGDLLNIDLALTHAGMNYQKVHGVSQTAAYLAELEANRNGADPTATATQFAQMTEQLGISTNAAAVKRLADQVNAISTITSASVSTLSESSKYFNLVGKIQGLTPSDIMLTQAMAARYGYEGSISGTSLKDFFERLNPMSHMGTMMGKPIVNAFASLGWLKGITRDKKGNVASASGDVFHDAKGNLIGADQIFSIMAQTYKHMGNKEQFNALITRVLGQQALPIASLVEMNPDAFINTAQQIKHVPGVNQGVAAYQQTFNQQFHSFTSTLADFGRQVGTMLLPSLIGYLKQLNANLPKLQTFIDKNKNLIKTLAEVWAGLAAFKIGSGVAKIAIGAPLREVFGLASGGVGMIKHTMGAGRKVRDFAATYRKLRKDKVTYQGRIPGKGIFESIAGAMNGAPSLSKLGSSIDRVSNKLKPLARGFAKFSGWSLILRGTNAAMSATVSGVTKLGGGIVRMGAFIARITRLTKAWALVQRLVNIVMMVNPITLIIAGIVALIAVIVLIVTHWKTCVQWLQNAWNWFKHLGLAAQGAIALIMPLVGIPAMIIAHWSQIASFFDGIWKHISPMITGIEHFLGFGGPSTPKVVSGSSDGRVNLTINHEYNIQSTDPKQTANEVQNKQDKYYRSRFPLGIH